MKKIRAIILGSTGATGQEILKLLLKNSDISEVVILVRRKIYLKHEKLKIYQIDFSNLSLYKKLIKGDIFISALGTTLNDAGSKNNQFLVDYTYQYELAKIASENNIKHYTLISSIGANQNSMFYYLKIKGLLEYNIKKLNFRCIHIFQPPSLIRQPDLIRKGERISIFIFNLIYKFGFAKTLKPISVEDLAIKVVNEIIHSSNKGVYVYKPKDISFDVYK